MFLIVGLDEEESDEIDFSGFSGNLRRDDRDNSRDCWKISDGNNFRVRSKNFIYDKSKVLIFPAVDHTHHLAISVLQYFCCF